MFNVSSITVVRALNELANDGYIIRQQGKGTFVSRARKHKLVEFSDVGDIPYPKIRWLFSPSNVGMTWKSWIS